MHRRPSRHLRHHRLSATACASSLYCLRRTCSRFQKCSGIQVRCSAGFQMMWHVDQNQVQTTERERPVDCRRRMPTRQNGPHRRMTSLWTIVQMFVGPNEYIPSSVRASSTVTVIPLPAVNLIDARLNYSLPQLMTIQSSALTFEKPIPRRREAKYRTSCTDAVKI